MAAVVGALVVKVADVPAFLTRHGFPSDTDAETLIVALKERGWRVTIEEDRFRGVRRYTAQASWLSSSPRRGEPARPRADIRPPRQGRAYDRSLGCRVPQLSEADRVLVWSTMLTDLGRRSDPIPDEGPPGVEELHPETRSCAGGERSEVPHLATSGMIHGPWIRLRSGPGAPRRPRT